MYRILADWMRGTAVALPAATVVPGPIEVGGRRLTAVALHGHSDGDLVLVDEASGTLLAGDLVFHDRAPATPDADLATWRQSLDALLALPHRQLVPGHGPFDPPAPRPLPRPATGWTGWNPRWTRPWHKGST
jgi:glyoxylase-like metal-dependent hydrolase (beta-lactamase superfamily II)